MKINLRSIFLSFSIMFVCFVASTNVEAVPDPGAIAWGSSPSTFVTSLYTGVLGRSPESAAVVEGWAAKINSNSYSRLSVFNGFINSKEYQESSYAKQKPEYTIYYYVRGKKNIYTVSKSNPNAYHFIAGPFSRGVAIARMGYYKTFHSNR